MRIVELQASEGHQEGREVGKVRVRGGVGTLGRLSACQRREGATEEI